VVKITLTYSIENLYILDFDTETRALGRYSFLLTLNKKNYVSTSALIELNIKRRGIVPILSDNFVDRQATVVKGDILTIGLYLKDPTKNNIPLIGATVRFSVKHDEYFDFIEEDDGYYKYEFETDKYDTFFMSKEIDANIYIYNLNYHSEYIEITIIIEKEEIFSGVPTFYFLICVIAVSAITGIIMTFIITYKDLISNFVKKLKR